ncbi:MAG: UDP-N-acetylmuramate:L-alanyl-gamma-D-glutamyl-meso-diaminopimelate ligase [Pseudomonadales bacterium]|nr:UDP-N-acetylmuramate:L-alanyl-gamma-D-glutamyl-meso-diaminopimelate ligase [Pseudomonadales bacterium]
MHIHILGICGTFMGSLAVLARQAGHTVSGSDANVYPPMSTQLEQLGIALLEGYQPEHLQPHPDLVIIGNALSRGNPAVEYVLDQGLAYCSGPQWLAQHVLHGRWVLGVAGTHGKTTTSAMLAWILTEAGLEPGYLIGGVARNFPASADLGKSAFFVVEADEYDSAFFDKRSKFVHYAPRTLVLNNLEFDHGDIFSDLAAIQTQFHHLLRTVPGSGLILSARGDENLETVLARGCWSQVQRFGAGPAGSAEEQAIQWFVEPHEPDASTFTISRKLAAETISAQVSWELTGLHNALNALAAVAAAHHVGVEVNTACQALQGFLGVKRRMELLAEIKGVRVYDDFAHHPTAIASTLQGMADRLATSAVPQRLIAVIEPRSNTMKMGLHKQQLAQSCERADLSLWLQPQGGDLDVAEVIAASKAPAQLFHEVEQIVVYLSEYCRPGDHIVIMSNGGFGGIHQRLLAALASREGP